MSYGTESVDLQNVPISSVYVPNVSNFPALQGAPGTTQTDSNGNVSAPIVAVEMPVLPTIVQKANGVTGTSGKTLSVAFASNNTSGNTIIVALGMGEVQSGATITLAVTDTLGNTYSQAAFASQSTTLESSIFYASNILSGANTITVTIAGASSTNTAIAAEIYEVWGLLPTVGGLDQTATASNTGSTAVSVGPTAGLVAPNEYVFTAIAAGGGTITAGTNWTLDSGTLSPTGGGLVSFGSESRLHGQFVPITATATLSGSNAWAATTATFKVALRGVEAITRGDFQEVSFSTTSAQAVASTEVSAYRWASVHITGQGTSSTVTFQGSNDNTNWVSVVLVASGSTATAGVTSSTTTGIWHGPLFYRYFRLNVTGISAGTTAGVIEFSTLASMLQSLGAQASQSGTWTVQPGNTANTTPWLASNHDGTNKQNVLAATSVSNALSAQAAGLVAGADMEVSFTTTTAQAVASTDVTNYQWVSVHITGQGTSSIVNFQGSNDNTNWVNIALVATSSVGAAPTINTSTTGAWHGGVSTRYFRLNVTGISAGTTAGVIEFHTLPSALQSSAVAQGGTWTVQPGNTQNTTAWLVNTPSSDSTVFASGAQTTTQTQADQTNNTARGIKVVLDMTVVTSSPSVTLEIDGKDIASGKYYSILTGAAVTTVSTNVYTIYPGLTASANVAANDILPHTWRIKVTANNANSGTYSVGASLLP